MSGPSPEEIKALGKLIPMEDGTVEFVHDFILLTRSNGEMSILRESQLAWGYPGEVDRVRRTITITVGEADFYEHLQSNAEGTEL